MAVSAVLKSRFRQYLNRVGWDVQRSRNVPRLTMLGLHATQFRTIVDVGSNEGQFARKIRKKYAAAVVYCFEPLPDAFSRLHAWASKQQPEIHCFNMAVGDVESTLEINVHTEHTPSSSLLRTTAIANQMYVQTTRQEKIQVEQKTLDQVMAEKSFSQPLLVKIDVQGYEDRVISGGRETLAKADACIAEVGVDTLYEGQATFSSILGQLAACGLDYVGNLEQIYADDGHCVYFDALFVRRGTKTPRDQD